MPPEQIKRGHVIALFAFDVGYEVDLQLLDTKLLSTDLQTTSGKKGVPLHDKRAASRPRILPMEDVTPLFSAVGRTQATFYDFGCISIRFCWSLGQDVRRIKELPQLSQRLYALDPERQARERWCSPLSSCRSPACSWACGSLKNFSSRKKLNQEARIIKPTCFAEYSLMASGRRPMKVAPRSAPTA
jgi:hypothetical protein